MTGEAPQAFLKFLEEPPPDTVVILVLPGVRAVPATVHLALPDRALPAPGRRPGEAAAVGEALALLQAARAEGAPGALPADRSPGSREAEALIDGCWLLCRDLLLVRAGAPAALLSDADARRGPRRRGRPLDRRGAAGRDRERAAPRVKTLINNVTPRLTVETVVDPPAGASRLRITMDDMPDEWLIGIRLRDTVPADDYKLVEDLRGDGRRPGRWSRRRTGTALGEVRRPAPRAARLQARPALPPRGAGRPPRRRRASTATAASARSAPSPPPSALARSREMTHEGGRRRDVRRRAAGDRVLQRRGPHRLPRPRARPRPRVPRAHRDAAGRRPRHHARDGRHRSVRSPALLLVTPARSSSRSR